MDRGHRDRHLRRRIRGSTRQSRPGRRCRRRRAPRGRGTGVCERCGAARRHDRSTAAGRPRRRRHASDSSCGAAAGSQGDAGSHGAAPPDTRGPVGRTRALSLLALPVILRSVPVRRLIAGFALATTVAACSSAPPDDEPGFSGTLPPFAQPRTRRFSSPIRRCLPIDARHCCRSRYFPGSGRLPRARRPARGAHQGHP